MWRMLIPSDAARGRVRLMLTTVVVVSAVLTMGTARAAERGRSDPALINWQPCTDAEFNGMDCGILQVPVD